ncbi:GNAT family N-acetyltransferase [Shewanella morhuae]|uniref:GNAT family N-acetyltransferase n=1 Tax=Shewanella morhuae TaxID=365591 RepID=A0A1N6T4B9_9GAMM|nr:GNAT family N-acetyltransferase [Shewanella morhuae]PTA50856.1 GNAT family N-acetyltransferase [Shewanella morhuae]GIU07671.1 GCN5 family N-acetyltransferase [Shewanella morhuae]SIQ48114.1 Acetyltransferase, GNAT family [Shewanella morhuae]SUI76144.1 putative acyltransferase [Shewanella morhuae]
MKIRLFTPADVSQLALIFEASVMQGSGEYYSFAERSAWAYIEGESRSDSYWLERLKGTTIWVAETENMLVGFINLKLGDDTEVEASAEIECLFVHPEYARSGVATTLYFALFEQVKGLALKRLTVEASYLARPFFEKQGFRNTRRNEHKRFLNTLDKSKGQAAQVLVNFSMTLAL